ncbi:zinc-ribbon and DUF3426 domain-containing protein [Acinetobacter piscicola]|uniref:zinc-ribbon and DUF3426 domain-containing protein n=1 Tax=Acinetobacter piscicola TaxID=2006115 RepID=UPI000B7C78B2|nr:zinc-ribbon and DUF3426 domain-containing protein [Acinetobacter piscicola]
MTEKQTRCPNCQTIYKVSVTQLTVAQGMVCCPKCSTNFNALLNLQINLQTDPQNHHDSDLKEPNLDAKHGEPQTLNHQPETHILDIFDRKIENSNIDLRTYLNNLNYFNNEPIQNIPSLNLSQGINDYAHQGENPKSTFYYASWGLINIALLGILLFQIVWFNPSLTDRYPLINRIFTQTCSILRCDTADQRYKHIVISNLQVKVIDKQQTQFTGQLNNKYSKSLELPLIKVLLKAHDKVVVTYIITPDEYLIESLIGIKRIPKDSPYPFKFVVTASRNTFDAYQLEVIHP